MGGAGARGNAGGRAADAEPKPAAIGMGEFSPVADASYLPARAARRYRGQWVADVSMVRPDGPAVLAFLANQKLLRRLDECAHGVKRHQVHLGQPPVHLGQPLELH